MQPGLYARLALLVGSSISSHFAYTAPNAPPRTDEQDKYNKQPATSFGERGFTAVHAASCLQAFVHVVNAISLIALLSSAGVHTIQKLAPWASAEMSTGSVPPAVAVGTVLMCVGTLLRVVSYHYLGRWFTFQLAIKEGHKLVTDGPYSIVRHPSYTGAWLFNVGVAISLLGPGSAYTELVLWMNPIGFVVGSSQLVFILYIGLVIGLRVRKEDIALKNEFPSQWLAWAEDTPCRLVPCIY